MNTKVFFATIFSIIFATCICAYCISERNDQDVQPVFLEMSSFEYGIADETGCSTVTEEQTSVITTTETTTTKKQQKAKLVAEKITNKSGNILIGRFKLTAYCSCRKCCGKYADNRPKDENGEDIIFGASGNRLSPNHSVAVDTRLIPYGTRLVINGHEYVAEDCGGAVKGNVIDVYFSSHEEACAFGAKYADVYKAVS